MRIHARLLDALHDRSAQVVNPLRAAKRPQRREALNCNAAGQPSEKYDIIIAVFT